MSLPIGSVYGTIEIGDKFSKPFEKFNNVLSTSVADVVSAAGKLNIFATGLGALATKAVIAAAEWEQTTIAFNTLLGSADKAQAFLTDMQEFAAKTPFELPGLLEGSRRLLAMGFAAEQVKPMLTAVGDAAAGLGIGGEGIQRITLALGQMQAKGKVSAEEMRQLAEAGIPAWEFLAEKIGVSIPQAMKMAETGAIKAADAIPALVEGMNKKFGGMMEAQSKTLMGMWSTVKDEMGFVLRDIGSAIAPTLKEMISGFMSVLPFIRDVARGIADVTNALVEAAVEAGRFGIELANELGPAISGIFEAIKEVTGGFVDFNTALKNASMAGDVIRLTWIGMQGAVINLSIAMAKASRAMPWASDEAKKRYTEDIFLLESEKLALGDRAQAIIEGTDAEKKATAATDAANASKKKGTAATEELSKAQQKLAEKLADVRNQYTGGDAIKKMDELEAAFKNLTLEQEVTGMGAQKLAEDIRKLQSEGAKIPPTFLAFAESVEEANRRMQEMGPTMDQLLGKAGTGGIAQLPQLMKAGGSFAKDLLGGVPASKTVFIDAGTEGGSFIGKGMGEGIKKTLGLALEGLPNVIMQAITGGGDIGKAMGGHVGQTIGKELGDKVGPLLGKALGATAGKALGSVLPVLGTLAGSFLGEKLGGFVGKLFGGEEKKVNDLRDAAISAAGGFEKLNEIMHRAGGDLRALLDAKNVKDFEKALADVKLNIAREDFIEASGGFAMLQERARQTGASLEAMVNAKTLEEYERALSQLKDTFDTFDEATNATQAALEKYDLTLQTSGKFLQDSLNREALAFFKEFELITKGAGVAVDVAIKAMGDKGFVDFINRARTAGASIPEAMRPMVQALIDNKLLLDENGNAFETAEEAGITFAQTVEESMRLLVEQITKMVNALLGIPNTITAPRVINPNADLPGGGDFPSPMDGRPQKEFAHYGIVTRPTHASLGEAGPEAIVPLHQALGGNMYAPLTVKVSDRDFVKTIVELHRGNNSYFRSDFGG